ncbi:glycosyltransferase family 4 protein [Aliiglaciecola sp. 2_MG-2023]|uniref:glycosyltransferase family 4 protein n=1 Tax=unclassified Aliiglaciecola TaxID=2593648 RepID=UPI0026E3619C|nr:MULTISPECIES: glycosyltransferase family 4 protein [unclassified Aliiglaciecola]MDO6712884.1 glycosyltransferase family 4 protein [Aliiglaciecola sp. 2_MG-2023]MDO6752880.1 glycosyltransferase family 4 protein [Aliiglaciecola sp. 1_MG-2023]
MKILVLSHAFFPSMGGIEVNTEILCRNFTEAGHQVTLITNTPCEDYRDDFVFPVVRQPSFIKIFKMFLSADIVFHNNPSFGIGYLSIFFNYKTIYAIRTWVARTNGELTLKDKIKQKLICNGKNRIYISQAISEHLPCAGVVIGNPYRDSVFVPKGKEVQENNFIFAGRLTPDKGVDLLIKAYSEIKNDYNLAGLSIAGNGGELKELIKLTEKLGIASEVKFLGKLNGVELSKQYSQHKFIVVPSRWNEPFGNVALEGIACGCVPIVSEGGGLKDAIGECGLTFKNGDLLSLIKVMRLFLDSHELIQQKRSVFKKHLSKHSEKVVAASYLRVLEGISK